MNLNQIISSKPPSFYLRSYRLSVVKLVFSIFAFLFFLWALMLNIDNVSTLFSGNNGWLPRFISIALTAAQTQTWLKPVFNKSLLVTPFQVPSVTDETAKWVYLGVFILLFLIALTILIKVSSWQKTFKKEYKIVRGAFPSVTTNISKRLYLNNALRILTWNWSLAWYYAILLLAVVVGLLHPLFVNVNNPSQWPNKFTTNITTVWSSVAGPWNIVLASSLGGVVLLHLFVIVVSKGLMKKVENYFGLDSIIQPEALKMKLASRRKIILVIYAIVFSIFFLVYKVICFLLNKTKPVQAN